MQLVLEAAEKHPVYGISMIIGIKKNARRQKKTKIKKARKEGGKGRKDAGKEGRKEGRKERRSRKEQISPIEGLGTCSLFKGLVVQGGWGICG